MRAPTKQWIPSDRLMKSKEEILQYNQARRERRAEQGAFATTVPDEAGIDILLITEKLSGN